VTVPAISAYVPCFNNVATVRAAVMSLVAQTVSPLEVLVVDDGSTDGSAGQLKGLDVRLIRNVRNEGRGAVRRRAMEEARFELVLCCDATGVLERTFVEKALAWFQDPQVAGVFGKITQSTSQTSIDRWRGRHLFKLGVEQVPRREALLATGGAIVRASAVRAVGGYNASLRHTEDGDLGRRLLSANFAVVYDPGLEVMTIGSNSLRQVLDRYWRWYAGTDETTSWIGYRKNIGYSIKAMAAADLRDADPLSAIISLVCPHYQFWRPVLRRRWW
jgi:glycosyltransferase involved in cell wall biosynthesis